MKKNLFIRTAAAIMAVSMMFSAFSCSSSGDADTSARQTAENIMSNAYKCREINNSVMFSEFGNIFPVNDGRYVFSGKGSESGQTEIYVSDSSFSTFDKIEPDIKEPENGSIDVFVSAACDGKIFALVSTTDYGDVKMPDYDDPEFNPDTFDFEALHQAAKYSYEIIEMDTAGNIISRNPVESKSEYENIDENGLNTGMSISDVTALKGDRVLLNLNMQDYTSRYVILSADGKFGDEVSITDGSIMGSFTDNNGNLVAMITEDWETYQIKSFDSQTLSAGETVQISNQTDGLYGIKMFQGVNDYICFAAASNAMYGVKTDGSMEEVINWVASDMNGDTIKAGIANDDGTFTVFINDWDNNVTGFCRLEKRDASEIAKTSIINLGAMYQSGDIAQMITAFNKLGDNVRINVVDYSEFDDYANGKSGEEQLKLDIIAGKAPDMVICNSTNMINSFSSKGVFVDLYNYLDKDENLGRDDILPNAIESGEVNGKLLSLSPTFYVQTLAAKKKFIDKENWTLDEMIDVYNNLPDEMRFFKRNNTKDEVFRTLYYGTNLIDFSKNTCNFDSDEFKKLLTFCNNFDEVVETDDESGMMDENEFNETETAIHDDKALLTTVVLFDPFEYAHMRYANFGEDISFVGYPSDDGRGASYKPYQCFAIMDSSKNKDDCWKFISSFFTETFYEKSLTFFSGFMSYRPAFEKQLDSAMSKPFNIVNGKKEERDDYA
jgi:ABC-type glycerol-3-phosphate transport system substrate-binding protein